MDKKPDVMRQPLPQGKAALFSPTAKQETTQVVGVVLTRKGNVTDIIVQVEPRGGIGVMNPPHDIPHFYETDTHRLYPHKLDKAMPIRKFLHEFTRPHMEAGDIDLDVYEELLDMLANPPSIVQMFSQLERQRYKGGRAR